MKILYVAAEALPFASSGGLGDVIGSLPEALNKLPDTEVRVVMPLYGTVPDAFRKDFRFLGSKTVELSWRKQYCGIFSYEYRGVTFYFVDNEYYFKRSRIYGEFDDGERFAFFCRAALEILPDIGYFPDILHAHDWHAALSTVYLKRVYAHKDARYSSIKSVITIHNIQYQGVYGRELIGDVFALGEEDIPCLEYDGAINLLKGGIDVSDAVTTVSPTYAEEILTPAYSSGLYKVLCGILNGIDRKYYNPSKDKEIAANYSSRNIAGKSECRAALRSSLGLPQKDVPLLAVVSRLAGHKGLDLLMLCGDELLESDVQLVVLGQGEKAYEEYFASLQRRFPDKCRALITYDRALSKRIYAAADVFIMPSKSEPCGLAQMIASRYGAIPVVHDTGGLHDSIKDISSKNGNGFTFAAYSSDELLKTVRRAVSLYSDRRDGFEALRKKVMNVDFTWKKSALNYKKLYEKLILE